MHWEQQGQFCVEYEEDGTIRSLKNGTDSYAMNWVEGERLWGTVTAPLEITVERVHSWEDTELEERYRFTNQASYPVYIQKGDLGIYLTFNDNYQEAGECLTRRCHTHIWCGGSASYVMALRMGGEGRHLGLRLTEGSFIDYSVERDLEKRSNDRGDFIMHPGISCLQPGETAEVAWHLFWFDDAADFTENLKSSREFPVIESPHFTWFAGEEAVGTVTISGSAVPVFCDGNRLECRWEQQNGRNIGHFSFPITEERDYRISLDTGRGETWALFHGAESLDRLVGRRCRFLAEKQQENRGELQGAYLIYDNEEKARYYSHEFDHNACRERVAMGCLVALWLQDHGDAVLMDSLDAYAAFILREIYSEETGDVCNDLHHDMTWDRMYNYPWMAQFFIEVYRVKGDAAYLVRAYRCLKRYYEKKGADFYAIGIPGTELHRALRSEGMKAEADQVRAFLAGHADRIRENGLHYPPHEVNYEQSIVAPAVSILLQAYELTGEEAYLQEGMRHMNVLLLFNGRQPDYHLYETAIRHWDGYWFGKRRLYGDTFPHYWSTLTGVECARLAAILKKNSRAETIGETLQWESYAKRAQDSLRGGLNLFRRDGAASCSYVYPHAVNGVAAGYYDPWANDQDWALYYAYKYREFCVG